MLCCQGCVQVASPLLLHQGLDVGGRMVNECSGARAGAAPCGQACRLWQGIFSMNRGDFYFNSLEASHFIREGV